MRKKGKREGSKCWVLVSDHGEGLSFAFKISRHIEKKIFSYLVSLTELKGNALINRQYAANMSLPIIMHHTWCCSPYYTNVLVLHSDI
jgi:hypothetical protein